MQTESESTVEQPSTQECIATESDPRSSTPLLDIFNRSAEVPPHREEMTERAARPNNAEIRNDIKFELNHLIEHFGFNFTYIRAYDVVKDQVAHNGGTVLCWVPTKPPSEGNGNVIELSTSICSPHDNFDKLLGRWIAARNFVDGQRILLRLPFPGMYSKQLHGMFGIYEVVRKELRDINTEQTV